MLTLSELTHSKFFHRWYDCHHTNFVYDNVFKPTKIVNVYHVFYRDLVDAP